MKASNENDEFLKVAICSLAFSFRHFQAVFIRHFFNTFFFAKEQERNGPFRAGYVTEKLKWKFAMRDSGFVTILVSAVCQKHPLYDPLWSIGLKVDFFPFNVR